MIAHNRFALESASYGSSSDDTVETEDVVPQFHQSRDIEMNLIVGHPEESIEVEDIASESLAVKSFQIIVLALIAAAGRILVYLATA